MMPRASSSVHPVTSEFQVHFETVKTLSQKTRRRVVQSVRYQTLTSGFHTQTDGLENLHTYVYTTHTKYKSMFVTLASTK